MFAVGTGSSSPGRPEFKGDLSPASSAEGNLGMSRNITRFFPRRYVYLQSVTTILLFRPDNPTKESVEEPLSSFEIKCSKILLRDRYLFIDDDVLTSVRCPAVLFLSCIG